MSLDLEMMGSHEITREEGCSLVWILIKTLWQIVEDRFEKCQGWRQEDLLENNNDVLNLSNESRNGEEGSDLRNI